MALDFIIAQLLMICNEYICCPHVLDQALWKVRSLGMDNFLIYSCRKYMVKVSTNNNITNPSQHSSIPITKIKRVLFENKVIIYT